jgi:hypothetical protein
MSIGFAGLLAAAGWSPIRFLDSEYLLGLQWVIAKYQV